MPNPHPLQVNPAVGFLRTFEGVGFVRGLPFPDYRFMGTRPVLGCWAGIGFAVAADSFDNFPRGHMVVDAPFVVFYQDREQGTEFLDNLSECSRNRVLTLIVVVVSVKEVTILVTQAGFSFLDIEFDA